jgi:hypothetical protein
VGAVRCSEDQQCKLPSNVHALLEVLKCIGFGEKLQILDYFCDTNEHDFSYSVANCFNIPMKVKNLYIFDTEYGHINAQKDHLNFQFRTSLNNSFTYIPKFLNNFNS